MKTNLVKSNSFLIILIKSLVICLSFWFIYHRIFVSQDFLQFQTTIKTAYLAKSFFPLFILVFILFIINWGTEAIKWRMLLQRLQKISFSESFKAVFSGITIGLFTPNRIGEYGGRIIYLDRDKRLDAVVNNVAGNFSQLLITLVFGVFGVIFYFFNFNNLNYGNKSMILLLFIPLVVILFFNINKIPALFGRKGKIYLKAFALFTSNELIKLILLSSFRYLIFFLQFYILLLIFNIELQYPDAMILLPVIFLVISIIPSFAIVEWGVRGSAALFFISAVSANSSGILAAATLLWLINIALPAIIGAVFITNHKLSINEF